MDESRSVPNSASKSGGGDWGIGRVYLENAVQSAFARKAGLMAGKRNMEMNVLRGILSLFLCGAIAASPLPSGTIPALADPSAGAGAVSQDLAKRSSVKGVENYVREIDAIIAVTDAREYADNGWQLMTADGKGAVKILRARQFQMWSDVAELCREYGYSYGKADFYYDNPDVSEAVLSADGPICIKADIDDVKYCYYFVGNQMIRRIGPEGVQDNPVTNGFLDSLYKLGVAYKKPGVIVKPGTFELYIISKGDVRKTSESFLIESDKSPSGHFVIDKATKLDFQSGEARAYDAKENGYSWYKKLYDDTNTASACGVYLVYASGEHIDVIYDTYWWD